MRAWPREEGEPLQKLQPTSSQKAVNTQVVEDATKRIGDVHPADRIEPTADERLLQAADATTRESAKRVELYHNFKQISEEPKVRFEPTMGSDFRPLIHDPELAARKNQAVELRCGRCKNIRDSSSGNRKHANTRLPGCLLYQPPQPHPDASTSWSTPSNSGGELKNKELKAL